MNIDTTAQEILAEMKEMNAFIKTLVIALNGPIDNKKAP